MLGRGGKERGQESKKGRKSKKKKKAIERKKNAVFNLGPIHHSNTMYSWPLSSSISSTVYVKIILRYCVAYI